MIATTPVPQKDIDILRRLGEKTAELSESTVNKERRQAWFNLDAGKNDRVMVLAEIGGVRDKAQIIPDDWFETTDPRAHDVEFRLRTHLYEHETLRDDHVLEPYWNVRWDMTVSDYGVSEKNEYGDAGEKMGSRRWDAPIKSITDDFARLHPRVFSVNREATFETVQFWQRVFGDTLKVRVRTGHYWTMGLTIVAISLIGLTNLMMFMYDDPEGLHKLMAFLRDDHIAHADYLENEGLYCLNNENDYIGSGSMGYANDLPHKGMSDKVRKEDLWVLCESQETVGVGPEQFEEFIFPYQMEIAKRFGKTYYGCCEPVNNRWHILKGLPNLARVSISPWADEAFMAREMGRDYVYSRKPNPTLVSTEVFDEAAIRADLRGTLDTAGDCRLEIIMKDVHTLNNEPDRLARWVAIARDEIHQAGRS